MLGQEEIKKIIESLPDSPGVYVFKRGGNILYIGKATSLKDRVRSYFSKDIGSTRSPLILKMLIEFDNLEYIGTDSVLEALVLEAHLIKKFQPPANIKEKDNRSFNFVVITDEEYPRALVVRGRELMKKNYTTLSKSTRVTLVDEVAYSFGPFPNGSQLKEALKIVRKMFPFRDKCTPNQGKPCFNRQIGLCPGVCSGEISKEEYAETIKNIILFFEGNKKALIKNLEKQMEDYALSRQFEKAHAVKKTIFTLHHIQDVSLIKENSLDIGGGSSKSDSEVYFRIESYDVAHMSGKNVVGVMTVVEDGEVNKSEYRKFKIKDQKEGQSGVNDTKALSEVLNRRFAHIEWRMPELIVVDGGKAQKNVVEKVLKQNNLNIPVVSVVKDERHKPREILGDKKWLKYEKEILLSNAEAHRYGLAFHKALRGKLTK